MGHRELKRVPMDFDWPLNKVWKGYINPHSKPCPKDGVECFDGYSSAGKWLSGIVNLLMLCGSQAKDHIHPWLRNIPFAPEAHPGNEMRQLTSGLAGRGPSFLGHDACDKASACEKIREAAGMPEGWGVCPVCHGTGIDPEEYEAFEAWKDIEPPTGDGYQLWETCSEGSPISPVFASAEELAEWCAEHATIVAREKLTREQWLRLFKKDDTSFGSLMVMHDGYFGSMANDPERTKD